MEANKQHNISSFEIEKLLSKYWKNETSLQEEEQLRSFFNQQHVADHLKKYQSLFVYQALEKQKRVSENFENDVLERIRQYEEPMKPSIARTFSNSWMKYAAIFILGFAVFLGYQSWKGNQIEHFALEDTEQTPEEALKETKKALLLISAHLNKGEEQVTKLATFNSVQENYLLKNEKKKL